MAKSNHYYDSAANSQSKSLLRLRNYKLSDRKEDIRFDVLPRPTGTVMGPGRHKLPRRGSDTSESGLLSLRKYTLKLPKLGL